MSSGVTDSGITGRDSWEIRRDVETLKEAYKIRKNPSRMTEVKQYVKMEREAEKGLLSLTIPDTLGDKRSKSKAFIKNL